jgi:hypothetical protein
MLRVQVVFAGVALLIVTACGGSNCPTGTTAGGATGQSCVAASSGYSPKSGSSCDPTDPNSPCYESGYSNSGSSGYGN